MTRQQAGVSADAVAKLVVKWRSEENVDRRVPAIDPYETGRLNRLLKCADELEALATAPPEQAADSEVTIALEQVTNALEECAVLLCEVHMRFGEPKIMDDDFQKEGEFTFKQAGQMYEEQAKRARRILVKAKSTDQPQAASDGALYASGEMVRCSQCLMPLSGAPESHLPNCVVRELQEQHEAKVRDDALEEAAATVNGVHTSYHHNDPAETIGTFVQRHSAAIQELIRSRKDMKNES